VKRVVVNALALTAADSQPDICAFGDSCHRLEDKTIPLCASLTSRRPNLVWRFVIRAVAAAANYGHKTKIESSKTTSTGAQVDGVQIAQSDHREENARGALRLLLRGWPR